MMKKVLSLVFIALAVIVQAQNDAIWIRIDKQLDNSKSKNKLVALYDELHFELDYAKFKYQLSAFSQNAIEVSIPNAEGILEQFRVYESSNFAPELQRKYPEIRSYKGVGLTDRTATLYFSISPKRIQTMVFRADKGSEFIESIDNFKSVYKVISTKNRREHDNYVACSTADSGKPIGIENKIAKITANNKVFKTFRLALSCNAEYTAYFGGSKAAALAGMNESMTRINGILGKDLAVKLELIANNDVLIYTNAITDPYSDALTGADNDKGATWNLELQRTLTATIGNSAYDIGHMVSGSGGGGNAGCIGCICVNPSNSDSYAKGSAWSAPSNNIPTGSKFDIDVFAHELGHQLGGSHTFSFKDEGSGYNVEPGSGTTIMAYAGVVSPSNLNVQFFSDDYFSARSIMQIQANLASKSCGTNTSLSNNPPIINAGLDYTIPKGTAFILKGTGTDADGDTITYTWEQNDTVITATDANSFCFPTKVDGPLFRSMKPSSSPIRYMPNQTDVLSNVLTSRWESVSGIERTLNFILTGRDNAVAGTSQTNSDAMKVNVSGTVGPFVVTSQNTDFIGWQSGTTQNITWTVNGVETLPGSSNVNIKLSTDGGLTFPISLATNIPNNGSTNILIPNLSETNCRLLIEPTNNIFYAVNSKVFAIGYAVTQDCKTYTFTTPVSIPDNVLTYTTRTINVPNLLSPIQDVNVSIAIEHAFMMDVQIELVAPSGTKTILQRSECGTDLNLYYDDSGNALDCALTTLQSVKPNRPLSVFNGENPSSTWTLQVRDVSQGDIGTLKSASLNICSLSYTPLTTNNFSLSDFAVYPNPNNGSFKIQFSSQSENDVVISVHDLIGRKVYESKYKKNSMSFNENLQLKNVNSGVYILSVIDGDKREDKKIIIKKDK